MDDLSRRQMTEIMLLPERLRILCPPRDYKPRLELTNRCQHRSRPIWHSPEWQDDRFRSSSISKFQCSRQQGHTGLHIVLKDFPGNRKANIGAILE